MEVDEEASVVRGDHEVIRGVSDSDNGYGEGLSAEGVVQSFLASDVRFEFSFDAVMVGHKIDEVVLVE